MFKLVFVMLALFAVSVQAADDVPWTKLYDSSKRFLEVCVSSGERSGMESTLRSRSRQRARDSETSADQAAYDIMLDWAASNQAKLKRKESATVTQACFYFVTFIDKGFAIPSAIRKSLTPSVVKDILEHLDAEIKKRQP